MNASDNTAETCSAHKVDKEGEDQIDLINNGATWNTGDLLCKSKETCKPQVERLNMMSAVETTTNIVSFNRSTDGFTFTSHEEEDGRTNRAMEDDDLMSTVRTEPTKKMGRNLLELPTEVLLSVFHHLDYKSLCRVGETCKELHEVFLDDTLWRDQCQKEFLVDVEDRICESWRSEFLSYHSRFARFHSAAVYREIRRLWNRMEAYLAEHDPEIYESLRDPCDYSEIQIVEQKLRCRFPPDLRCSLQIHNGQQMDSGLGVCGCMAITTYFRSEGLLDAASMARSYENFGDLIGCVPLTYCYDSCKSQYIAVNDEGGFTVGEVFYPTLDQQSSSGVPDIFITGKSYTEWFRELVETLEGNKFPRIDGQIFRFEHNPDCVAVTNDVFTVKASTCFMPDLSTINPPHFLFIYRITMSMDPQASVSDSCQLETRHWIITDEDEFEETVSGPGVVGQFPMMYPGAEFSWISCTTFPTTYGNMKGHFVMRNQAGETMQIACPTYHMKVLPYKTSKDRRQQLLLRKKNL